MGRWLPTGVGALSASRNALRSVLVSVMMADTNAVHDQDETQGVHDHPEERFEYSIPPAATEASAERTWQQEEDEEKGGGQQGCHTKRRQRTLDQGQEADPTRHAEHGEGDENEAHHHLNVKH